MAQIFYDYAEESKVVQYTTFASIGLLTYECFITFGDEVELIWHSNWNIGKILFFATKYLGFIDCTVMLVYLLDSNLGARQCKQLSNAYSYIAISGIVIAEMIMSFRVYALWGKTRRIFVTLVFLLLTEVTVAVVVFSKDQHPIYATHTPELSSPCLLLSENTKPDYVGFSLLMAFECVIMLLTVWKGIIHWREDMHESTLLAVFYRDGALYFFFLFALSSANFAIWFQVHASNKNFYLLLLELQRVFHSVISARIVLNLRETALHEQTQLTLTTVEFRCENNSASASRQCGDLENAKRGMHPSLSWVSRSYAWATTTSVAQAEMVPLATPPISPKNVGRILT